MIKENTLEIVSVFEFNDDVDDEAQMKGQFCLHYIRRQIHLRQSKHDTLSYFGLIIFVFDGMKPNIKSIIFFFITVYCVW